MTFPYTATLVYFDGEGGRHRYDASGATETEATGRLRRMVAFMVPELSEPVVDALITVSHRQDPS